MTSDDIRGHAAIFDPRRLALAREARGLRKNDVAALIGVTPAAVSQYELGAAKPSASTLAKLSLALGFPGAFFARGRPLADAHGDRPHFRSLRAATQVERNRASALCRLTWELGHALGQRLRLPALAVPSRPVPADATPQEIEAVALQVRRDLGVPPGPVGNVVRLLESKGVVVARFLGESSAVDAFSQAFAERPVVCLYADKNDGGRARHDAAHELGHLVMHTDAEPGDRVLEQQAHQFAAAFLAPAAMIGPKLSSRIRWDDLLDLKMCWGVSMRSLLVRSRALDVISESTYRRAMVTLRSRWGDNEPGEVPPEVPTLFSRAIEVLNAAGREYSAEHLARDARLPHDLTNRLANLGDDDDDVVLLEGSAGRHSTSRS